MSMLENLVGKIDSLCERIHSQNTEIQELKERNEELENLIRQKEEQISAMMIDQSNDDRQFEDLLARIESVLEQTEK